MIKAILFDLGRVIVPFDFQRMYARIAPRCGIPASGIPDLLRPTQLYNRFESGTIGTADFRRELSTAVGLTCTEEEFAEFWYSIFLPDALVPENLLAALAKNYRMVLVSNTNPLHFPMLRANYPHIGYFHVHILSYEVGAMKPLPLIYQRAIASAGCEPDECFFTDDMPEFVAGAREQGIDAVQFVSAAETEKELRKRGVSW